MISLDTKNIDYQKYSNPFVKASSSSFKGINISSQNLNNIWFSNIISSIKKAKLFTEIGEKGELTILTTDDPKLVQLQRDGYVYLSEILRSSKEKIFQKINQIEIANLQEQFVHLHLLSGLLGIEKDKEDSYPWISFALQEYERALNENDIEGLIEFLGQLVFLINIKNSEILMLDWKGDVKIVFQEVLEQFLKEVNAKYNLRKKDQKIEEQKGTPNKILIGIEFPKITYKTVKQNNENPLPSFLSELFICNTGYINIGIFSIIKKNYIKQKPSLDNTERHILHVLREVKKSPFIRDSFYFVQLPKNESVSKKIIQSMLSIDTETVINKIHVQKVIFATLCTDMASTQKSLFLQEIVASLQKRVECCFLDFKELLENDELVRYVNKRKLTFLLKENIDFNSQSTNLLHSSWQKIILAMASAHQEQLLKKEFKMALRQVAMQTFREEDNFLDGSDIISIDDEVDKLIAYRVNENKTSFELYKIEKDEKWVIVSDKDTLSSTLFQIINGVKFQEKIKKTVIEVFSNETLYLKFSNDFVEKYLENKKFGTTVWKDCSLMDPLEILNTYFQLGEDLPITASQSLFNPQQLLTHLIASGKNGEKFPTIWSPILTEAWESTLTANDWIKDRIIQPGTEISNIKINEENFKKIINFSQKYIGESFTELFSVLASKNFTQIPLFYCFDKIESLILTYASEKAPKKSKISSELCHFICTQVLSEEERKKLYASSLPFYDGSKKEHEKVLTFMFNPCSKKIELWEIEEETMNVKPLEEKINN